jgi:Family of unknown function (DUF6600)
MPLVSQGGCQLKISQILKLPLPAFLACATLVTPLFGQEIDPPGRVARLSFLSGTVSFQASGEDQWNQATLNYPLTTGDRIYTDQDGRAELETGNIAVRVSANTDLTTSNLNDQLVQLGLSQGTLRVRAYEIREGNSVEIDTPTAALTLLRAGSYRVESYPDDNNTTVLTVNSGDVEVNGPGFSQTVHAGQAVKMSGADQVQVEFVAMAGGDDFDRWSGDRDQRFLSSQSRTYVGPYVPGYADLDQYGAWQADPDYGQVWFPTSVAAGWVPYRYGHWAWVEPWGWTWVEDEPWGFAPFHYGRWVAIGPRWGWIPGPVAVVPVYAPALVAFVGGGGFGAGVQVWFPLGPRDPYFPWYHHSDVYLRQVNVANVTVRSATYVNNYINVRNVNDVHYAYQHTAPTAVSNEVFRSSQPVARQVVRVNPDAIGRAQVIPHPEVSPDARAVAAGAPAAHPPAQRFRPTFRERGAAPGGNPAGAQPGGNPTVDRGAHTPTAPVTSGPGNAGDKNAHNPPAPVNPPGGNVTPDRGTHTPPAPVTSVPSDNGDKSAHTPPNPANPAGGNVPLERGAHTPPSPPVTTGGASTPGNNPPPNRRSLVVNAQPPPQKPAFSQRQPALEEHPGRPLEPQQVDNLRRGQPAGAMHDREVPAHQPPPPPPPKSNPPPSQHEPKPKR